jgi:L-aspartate oxidase
LSQDLVPVWPIQHFQLGGIEATWKGRTNKDWIFALGECSYTGFHGKNRLASNSLLECGVMALKSATTINKWIDMIGE